jgi:hypothetical protein
MKHLQQNPSEILLSEEEKNRLARYVLLLIEIDRDQQRKAMLKKEVAHD